VLESEGVKEEQWNSFFSKIIDDVNSSLPNYSQISSFRIQEEEFDKTPKRSIKRFKYQK
jgi:long-chain acyl-CoA synthetase